MNTDMHVQLVFAVSFILLITVNLASSLFIYSFFYSQGRPSVPPKILLMNWFIEK